jgi:hypothetical protein
MENLSFNPGVMPGPVRIVGVDRRQKLFSIDQEGHSRFRPRVEKNRVRFLPVVLDASR